MHITMPNSSRPGNSISEELDLDLLPLKNQILQTQQRIHEKRQTLYEMLLQQIAFKNLVKRNKKEADSAFLESIKKQIFKKKPDKLALPFIVAVTSKNAEIQCQIGEDELDYVLSFNEPLKILDDVDILRAIGMSSKNF